MTGAQASYVKTLCEEANEEFDPGLSKAGAWKRIEYLQPKKGRVSRPSDQAADDGFRLSAVYIEAGRGLVTARMRRLRRSERELGSGYENERSCQGQNER